MADFDISDDIRNPKPVPEAHRDSWLYNGINNAMHGSRQPCGCFQRLPDYATVLCVMHLAELNHHEDIANTIAQLRDDLASRDLAKVRAAVEVLGLRLSEGVIFGGATHFMVSGQSWSVERDALPRLSETDQQANWETVHELLGGQINHD